MQITILKYTSKKGGI